MLLTPLPHVKPYRTPSPLERDVLYGRPLSNGENLKDSSSLRLLTICLKFIPR